MRNLCGGARLAFGGLYDAKNCLLRGPDDGMRGIDEGDRKRGRGSAHEQGYGKCTCRPADHVARKFIQK